jgi:N-acyl homoserine lactone hydrolase
MKRPGTIATLLTLLIALALTPAVAQSPAGMRLYVFSSGELTLAKSILQSGASQTVTVPVGFFVVVHPQGTVLFDTGNNDRIITDPGYWGPFIAGLNPVRTPDVAIDVQLGKIGLKPDDIKYVVYSHFHVDHVGNMGKFPKSTHVFQKSEIANAFYPAAPFAVFFKSDDFAMLRNDLGQQRPNRFNTMELHGDLDLFRDNSVFIKRFVSHTPGSQILVVRLPKSGTVLLPGDAIYLKENLDQDILPSIGSVYSPPGMMDAYKWAREMRDREHANIIFSHDPDVFKASKRAPDFYE